MISKESMKPVLIIKLGDTMPDLAERRGDFEDWFNSTLNAAHLDTHVVDPCRGDALPPPVDYSGIVLTGSHSMVTDREEWSRKTTAWLPGAVQSGVPLLGVCYGHQLLAVAMGGTVDRNPRGMEMGTVEISFSRAAEKDTLLKKLPRTLLAHASHTQSVIALPPDAVLLAFNDNEPHHAFFIGACAWGIQFHPEFDADIMKTYIRTFAGPLKAEGQDVELLLQQVEDTPHGRQMMERFVEIVVERSVAGR